MLSSSPENVSQLLPHTLTFHNRNSLFRRSDLRVSKRLKVDEVRQFITTCHLRQGVNLREVSKLTPD